jgi:hypothetical protein
MKSMNIRPLLILAGLSLLAGCAYSSQPVGYVSPGYTSGSPYYYGYQPVYHPAYQTTYQAYPNYQSYQNRPAPYAYPLFSPQFPYSNTNEGSGG